MKTPITKEQIQSLILNAYGFMSRSGDLYFCQEDYVQDETFELVNIDGNPAEFNYNNAFVCNGSVTFEDNIFGAAITFTVLVVATDGSGVMPKLLACDKKEIQYNNSMKVEFNNLPDKQELTIVTLGDYFGGGDPDVQEVTTKEKFIEEQLSDGEYSFEEFMDASGDGGDNYIVLTIWNNQIAVVG